MPGHSFKLKDKLLHFAFLTTKKKEQCLVSIFEIWRYHIICLEILLYPIYWVTQTAASFGWIWSKKELYSRFRLQYEHPWYLVHMIHGPDRDRNTYSRRGQCVESHANLSGRDPVQNPRVLEQGNAICIEEQFTIQKAALGLLVSPDRV